MTTYLGRHLQVFLATLGNILRSPLTTLNTVIIIAITLLLPTLLYVVIKSAQAANQSWQGRPQITVFLQQDITQEDAEVIFEEIQLTPEIAKAELITPQQALQEFTAISGLKDEIDFLGKNPLPASVVIMPQDSNINSADLSKLKQQIEKIDGIENIRLDLDWTNRFTAILKVSSRAIQILSALLALGLILIVSNTIRLIILNRRAEIEVTKLVGGTDAFIRRPFLYYGLLLGLLGALLTIILLFTTFHLLDQPINHLASLYGSNNPIYQINFSEIAVLCCVGGLLGWLAARLSVARHLREIEPK